MEFNTTYFGRMVIEKGDSTSRFVEVQVNGKSSRCHLFVNIEDPELIPKAIVLADRLSEFDRVARNYFEKVQSTDNEVVAEYVDFHLAEASEEIEEHLGVANPDRKTVVQHLELCGVAFHGEKDDFGIVCDYSISAEFCDAVLAALFYSNGQFLGIEWES